MQNGEMNNNERILSEDDEALIVFLALCLIFSIFIPILLLFSPSFVKDGPLLCSLFILGVLGPGLLLSNTEMRFLLSGIVTM